MPYHSDTRPEIFSSVVYSAAHARYTSPTKTTLPEPLPPVATVVPASRGDWWPGVVLLAAWLVLWNRLRVDWSVNDQYAYGWFVPPLAALLGWLRWRDRPEPAPPRGSAALPWLVGAGISLALLWPVRLSEEPNGDWRLLSWAHAGLLAALTLAAAGWSGGRPWARHFLFPTAFLLLALPWPSGPEQTIVQGLQRGVAGIAADLMGVLGVPAEQQGNLIRVRGQLVGVNEACSGIRSLQTVLMAGLFLGELSRLSWTRRAALLGGGIAVAMAANVFRSSLLVWLAAQHGAATLDKYHDAAGISVLVIVFVGLLILNGRLEGKRGSGDEAATVPARAHAGRAVPVAACAAALAWLAATELGTEAWYRLHERGRTPQPTWTVAFPEHEPGFRRLNVDDVSRSLLRYDLGLETRWHSTGQPAADCTGFFFRWEPGRTSTVLAVMHQPTACLPAAGLRQVQDLGVAPVPAPGGFTLPVHAYEFRLHEQPLYVFYVVWQDQTGYELPAAAVGVSRFTAVRLGQRNQGQQTLELVVTGAADAEAARLVCGRVLGQIVKPKA